MNDTMKTALGATLALVAGVAGAADVALLSEGKYHRDEYYAALRKNAVEFDEFNCPKEKGEERLGQLVDRLGEYKLVLVSPLFNYTDGKGGWNYKKESFRFGEWRKWLADGGMLVVPDFNYAEIRAWVEEIEPSLKSAGDGKCTSDPWQVFDSTRNVEPVDAIRGFPNLITQGDVWRHLGKAPEGWKTLTTCSEGKPVVISKRIGKGRIVVSNCRFENPLAVENFIANTALLGAGLDVASFSMPEPAVGVGEISLGLAAPAPKDTRLYYDIVGTNGQARTFSAPFDGSDCRLVFTNAVRGASTVVTLGVQTPDGRKTALVKRVADLPQLFELKPNAYRGIISTKRRKPTVDFRVELAPVFEDFHGAKIDFEVIDSVGNLVYATNVVLAAEGEELKLKQWVPLALPMRLAPDRYSLQGVLTKAATKTAKRISAKSETAFEIVAPHSAQVVIDDDNTFLVNGIPFFPLGIYHVEPKDYGRVAKLGFNTIQYFQWTDWADKYGSWTSLRQAEALGLRLLFENVRLERCKIHSNDPAILAWYVADEAMEGDQERIRTRNNDLHATDRNHPTYLLSCRPDLFKKQVPHGDIFATNGSSTHKEKWMTGHLGAIDAAREASEFHQPIVTIPWGETDGKSRADVYAALAHDVRGVIWYCWSQAGGGPVGIGMHRSESDQIAASNLISEVKVMMPGLTSTKRRTFVAGDIHGMVCGDGNNNRFLILVNTGRQPVTADLEIPELKKVRQIAAPFMEGQSKTDVKDGVLPITLKSREDRVYRW